MRRRPALLGAALLMAATGVGFAAVHGFWPLLLIAFVGTLNPSGGDVSVFLPLEHTVLAHTTADEERTAMFARYSFVGAAFGAVGALSAGAVDWFAPTISPATTLDLLFVLYGVLGLITFWLYRGLSPAVEIGEDSRPSPLGPSRRRVYKLAALFSIDAFGGGLVVNALLALWLYERFGLSVATTGAIFFATKLCSAVSYFLAVPLSQALRPRQHDGVHAPAGERVPDADRVRADHRDRLRAPHRQRVAVRDGRAHAVVLRDGRGQPGGAARGGERDRRPAQPCLRARAAALGVAPHREPVRVAARSRGGAQGRLRPRSPVAVREGEAARGGRGALACTACRVTPLRCCDTKLKRCAPINST